MIFDIKVEDFRRKAILVTGGHVTKPPATITYESVVSRETVHVALTVADSNDLQVRTVDIQNAYIQATVDENIWTVLGSEFGPDAWNPAEVVRALYGIKSAGASFWNHLDDCMKHMKYMSCTEDPDLWMKPMVRPSDGSEYYAYILIYIDDFYAFITMLRLFLQNFTSILS